MAEKTRAKVEVKAQSRGEKNRSGSHKLAELNELAALNCTKSLHHWQSRANQK